MRTKDRRKLTCGQAYRDDAGRILCKASGTICAHQKWCAMIGMAVLTDTAAACPACRTKTEGME